jgi:hypothetical protein
MAVTWTKTFSSSDDGSALTGAQLGQIQTDIDTYTVQLAGTQTITGVKTLSGNNTHSGNNTFSGNNTHSGTNTFSSTNNFTGAAVFTGVSCIAWLATVTGVDMKTSGVTSLYTVPASKVLYVTHVVIRNPSASMAGGTDFDFGVASGCSSWAQSVDLSSLTTANTDYYIVSMGTTKYTECAAAEVFAIKVSTGTTAACTATIDVFGFLAAA